MPTTGPLVLVVVFDGCNLIDLGGPAEVFHTAGRLGAEPGYEVLVASLDGGAVRSACGVVVQPAVGLDEVVRDGRAVDTLLVVGGTGCVDAAADPELCAAVATLGRRARRAASVCTGAIVLAAAGLLAGRRATTHWVACDALAAAHPDVTVEPDRIYVRDGDRWTSAGVTAAIDLALALVEDDHGGELAHAVAGWLVVFVRRPGGQAQFSAQMRAMPARTPVIAELQRWLPDHLDEDLSVPVLAARCAMSVRTFGRAFRAETGRSPAAAVEEMRIEAAKRLLESTDLTVTTVARRVGLRTPEVLHRAFRRRAGTTPGAYRQHFRRVDPAAATG